MAENWLDAKALSVLSKKSTGFHDDPILIDSTDDEPEIQTPETFYMKSKMKVMLPNTDDSEEIQYVPPKLPPNRPVDQNSNTEPQFMKPNEHFDMFEHFKFTWIESSELEQK